MSEPYKMSMQSVRHIVPAPWMRAHSTQRLMDALEHRALFVGGCVRNLIIGREVEDYDLATPLTPQIVMERLKKAGIKAIPTGIDHGTVTAICDDVKYEITTLRRDVETDGRRAVIAFTDDWREDAMRRDFTMNTLLADGVGNIYDPLGQGLDDLDRGHVRFVGDASQRIAEDHLRILRYFRFHALYGRGDYDPQALSSCADGADQIHKLSRERIAQEFYKIIACDKAADILRVMFAHGVLKDLNFPSDDLTFFSHFCTFQSRFSLSALSARLFVLADMNLDHMEAIERVMIVPKIFMRDASALFQVLTLSDLVDEKALHKAIYGFGRSITAQALMIELVQDRVMNGYAPQALKVVQGWDAPTFPLNGQDFLAAGLQGEAIGRKMQEIENWWIDQDFKPDRAACLKQI